MGSLTGLIPGFHVNNVALILLALSPRIPELGYLRHLAVAAIIVSTGTVHTFLKPYPVSLAQVHLDGDTALLPSYRDTECCCRAMPARGVAWSARGKSQLGLFLSLPLDNSGSRMASLGDELGWYDYSEEHNFLPTTWHLLFIVSNWKPLGSIGQSGCRNSSMNKFSH